MFAAALPRASILLTAFLAVAQAASAAPTLAKAGGPAVEVLAANLTSRLQWLDGRLIVKEPARLDAPNQLTLEKVALVVTFRAAAVRAEKTETNSVFGHRVPGRSITARIKVDCLIHCAFGAADLKIEIDTDYPDTVKIMLPACAVSAEFPPNEDADYEVDYGPLRSSMLDTQRTRDLRRDLYREALQRTRDKFANEQLTGLRSEVAKHLQRLLRERFPHKRIHVVP